MTVSCRPLEPQGDQQWAELVIAVADTGVGIPPARQSSIFAAFEQGEPSTFGGVGLGLSISREVTRLMGGEIELQSVPGEGSTFTVRLRVQRAPAGSSPAADPCPSAPAPQRALRLLVAEDNRVNRRLIARFLEDAGHEVTFVHDGLAAIDAITTDGADGRFDVALIDVQMPGADGPEVARRRRRFERQTGAPCLPMVAVTAHAMKGDREALLEAGLDDHLAKPFSRADLAAAIARAAASRLRG